MSKYRFKYWFEWGCSEDCCPCLWGIGDATQEKYGYEVDLNDLPISNELREFLFRLGIKHDKALDWDYPPNPLLWTPDEEKQFYQLSHEGYDRLVDELGDDYEIIYCEAK